MRPTRLCRVLRDREVSAMHSAEGVCRRRRDGYGGGARGSLSSRPLLVSSVHNEREWHSGSPRCGERTYKRVGENGSRRRERYRCARRYTLRRPDFQSPSERAGRDVRRKFAPRTIEFFLTSDNLRISEIGEITTSIKKKKTRDNAIKIFYRNARGITRFSNIKKKIIFILLSIS